MMLRIIVLGVCKVQCRISRLKHLQVYLCDSTAGFMHRTRTLFAIIYERTNVHIGMGADR